MAEVAGSSYTVTASTDLCAGSTGTAFCTASGGTAVVVTYTMRGRRIADGLLYYWYPTGAPDPTGALSPYPGGMDQIVCLGSRTA